MKRLIILGLLIITSLCSFTHALAEEAADYQTNGQTSFYGVYEYPDESKDDSKASSTSNGTKTEIRQVNAKGQAVLIATGDNYFNSIQFLGLCILTIIFIYLRRKNEKKLFIINKFNFTK
ncbi:MAG: hypothetical protein LKF42_06110 [Streptococcaceae bacterium]|jgi:hypothetical protein|nr:hypothetical protein [Streptococcaceae bacterium]MCH4177053.1 hypothetical protein [Streptococcaceae bacterium]